jgi:hypothetical protein
VNPARVPVVLYPKECESRVGLPAGR